MGLSGRSTLPSPIALSAAMAITAIPTTPANRIASQTQPKPLKDTSPRCKNYSGARPFGDNHRRAYQWPNGANNFAGANLVVLIDEARWYLLYTCFNDGAGNY